MTELEEQAAYLPPNPPPRPRRRSSPSALYAPKSEDPQLLEAENVLAALAAAGYFDDCHVSRMPGGRWIDWPKTRPALLHKARGVLVGHLRGIEVRAYLSRQWRHGRRHDHYKFRALWRKKKVASAAAQR